jgi:hypothetical protein
MVSSICLGMNRIEPAVSPFQARAHPLQGCIRAHRAPVSNFLGAFCVWWRHTLPNVERGHEISQRHQRRSRAIYPSRAINPGTLRQGSAFLDRDRWPTQGPPIINLGRSSPMLPLLISGASLRDAARHHRPSHRRGRTDALGRSDTWARVSPA